MRPLLIAAVLLAGCVQDNGRIIWGMLQLYQEEYPVSVELVGGDDLDDEIVGDAVAWWNDQAQLDVFVVEAPGEVTVDEGYVECDDLDACPLGVADVVHNADAEIISCDITLSSDGVGYHRPTLELVLRHELGHCLGLDDDPGSLDLNSIMSDPVREGSGLTDHDRELLR